MANAAAQRQELSENLPQANSQRCVLLIEDNEDAMFLVRYALQEYGKGVYQLEWADGLSAGMERLKEGGIDIVLLDLGLPESSGPASYAKVREVAPDIPVLVLTGDTREETEFAITAYGVEDYLIKEDVSGSLLMRAIRVALHTSERSDIRKQREGNFSEDGFRAVKVGDFVSLAADSHN